MGIINPGLLSISKSGEAKLRGDVTLSNAGGMSITQVGQNIQLSSITGLIKFYQALSDSTLTDYEVSTEGSIAFVQLTTDGSGSSSHDLTLTYTNLSGNPSSEVTPINLAVADTYLFEMYTEGTIHITFAPDVGERYAIVVGSIL